jgi:REP element-mobilizing transposase RayT
MPGSSQPHAHDESSSRGARDLAWFHFWFSTFGTWLRGDVRGFRDHDHRIHSSVDYRDPPPRSEHAGLRRWVVEHLHKDPVRLPVELRSRAGISILEKFRAKRIEIVVLAVAEDHVHGIGRFPEDQVRAVVGKAKRASSHAIPGVVWAKKCGRKRIRSREQQQETFRYIARHATEGAWLWTFRDPQPGGAINA